MRIYSIQTKYGIKLVRADELKFEDESVFNLCANEPLVFKIGERLAAVFRDWDEFSDITDEFEEDEEKC
jgi:hypothetical protein